MNYAFTNRKLLDGNRDMQVQTGLCILVKDGLISDIVPDTADVTGYRRVDLHGHYILPGLINMHVHLTGSIEKGKAADLIVTAENPLEDLRALRNLELVVARGNVIEHPVIKKRKKVEAELDKFL